jgi:hypothetical protein
VVNIKGSNEGNWMTCCLLHSGTSVTSEARCLKFQLFNISLRISLSLSFGQIPLISNIGVLNTKDYLLSFHDSYNRNV